MRRTAHICTIHTNFCDRSSLRRLRSGVSTVELLLDRLLLEQPQTDLAAAKLFR